MRQSLPELRTKTDAFELFSAVNLIEGLSPTDILQFPLEIHHTGKNSIPDLRIEMPGSPVAIEMAAVSDQHLEWARKIQEELPERPLTFQASQFAYPESFARKIKLRVDPWSNLVASRLSEDCKTWLLNWNGTDHVPYSIQQHLADALNAIVEGPSLGGAPQLANATPSPEKMEPGEFGRSETRRDRRTWLEEAFWDVLAVPLNATLSTSEFLRADNAKMSRSEVINKGFLVPAMPYGPTIQEARKIWVEKVMLEITDKSAVLSRSSFVHGKEDWLVLWDRFGTPEFDLEQRTELLAQSLAAKWKPDWFTRIFVQDEYFSWQVMFTASGAYLLPHRPQQ